MQIKIAPSLGDLEHHPNVIWDTTPYEDINAPAVFFGLYGLPDFFALWRHKGEKHILWAGSDIRHFLDGYWLDDEGKIRLYPYALAVWIMANCTSWVENQVEASALERIGIRSNIVPSFLGKVEDFPLSFVKQERIQLYTSVSGNDFELYGWDKIPELAKQNPDIDFVLYGHTKQVPWMMSKENPLILPNIIQRGRVPKEVMNAEIKTMTGALRLTEFDGFSEIIAKSLLMGQWPVSLIEYPYTLFPHDIRILKQPICSVPNLSGRNYYLSIINKYPWNLKK